MSQISKMEVKVTRHKKLTILKLKDEISFICLHKAIKITYDYALKVTVLSSDILKKNP